MNHQQLFRIRAQSADSLELDIYDRVGDNWWGDSETSAKAVRAKLRDAKDAKAITVRINSVGGSVIDGLAIYNLLRDHAARVTVHVDAMAASIASVIAMAGDEIIMAEGAFMMIHNPSGVVVGEAADMREFADLLDKMRDVIVDVYTARTGQKRADVLAAVTAETWMTGKEAAELGYATKVVPMKAQAGAQRAAAAWNVADFERVPDAVRAAVEAAAAAKPATPAPAEPPPSSNPPPPAAPAAAVPPASPAATQPLGVPTMMAHILIKLGLPADATEADAVAEIDRRDLERAGLKADVANFVALSGKKTVAEARGTLEAWSSHGTELATARGQIAVLETNQCNAEAKALLDAAQQERKIVPATRAKSEAIYIKAQAAHGAKEALDTLKSHLEALVPVAPAAEMREQRVDTTAAGAGAAGATHDGKRYEDMTPGQRAELRATGDLGERMYQDLRADWQRRGSPKSPSKAA